MVEKYLHLHGQCLPSVPIAIVRLNISIAAINNIMSPITIITTNHTGQQYLKQWQPFH